MIRYSGLLRELGEHDRAADHAWKELKSDVTRLASHRPDASPMRKATEAMNGAIATHNRNVKAMVPERDVAWHRRQFARMDQEATLLAKSGDLTVEQGSILDRELDSYYRRHCQ